MRHKYQLPPDEELISQINMYHKEALDEHLERYKFIWQEFGPLEEMLLVGGISAFLAMEETLPPDDALKGIRQSLS